MPDRRDYVTRARRHQQAEWAAGAAKMANGIEIDRIQSRRAAMSHDERAAERADAVAQDGADHAREARRAARRHELRHRRANRICEICGDGGAHHVDSVLLCDRCAAVLA